MADNAASVWINPNPYILQTPSGYYIADAARATLSSDATTSDQARTTAIKPQTQRVPVKPTSPNSTEPETFTCQTLRVEVGSLSLQSKDGTWSCGNDSSPPCTPQDIERLQSLLREVSTVSALDQASQAIAQRIAQKMDFDDQNPCAYLVASAALQALVRGRLAPGTIITVGPTRLRKVEPMATNSQSIPSTTPTR